MKKYKIALLGAALLLVPANATLTKQNEIVTAVACAVCSSTSPILYEDATVRVTLEPSSCFRTSLLITLKKGPTNLDMLDLDKRSDQQLLIHSIWVAQYMAARLTGEKRYRISINNDQGSVNCPHLCIRVESNDNLA
jgi:diadenosine tetraphosphate (Ap4A) HIT family hydrolase